MILYKHGGVPMNNPIFQKTKQIDINENEFHKQYDMRRQHYHDSYEIYLQLDGERNLFFDNEKYVLKKGSLFVMAPFVLHMTNSTENIYFKRYILNFSNLAASSILTFAETEELLNGLNSCVTNLDENQLNETYFYFSKLNKYLYGKKPASKKLTQMSLVLLIEHVKSLIKTNMSITLLENSKNNKAPIYTAIAYINSNYEHDITLDFISEYVHMSKSNFCLVFKKIIGETFIDYLNAVRITQAHKLLMSANLTLKEIARKTGFSSPDYMARIFKKVHGVSPSEFKKGLML